MLKIRIKEMRERHINCHAQTFWIVHFLTNNMLIRQIDRGVSAFLLIEIYDILWNIVIFLNFITHSDNETFQITFWTIR